MDFRERIVRHAREDWLNPYPDPDQYRKESNGTKDPDWCGHWIAAVGIRAGLAKDIARHVMQSTYRLASHKFPGEDKIGWVAVRSRPVDDVPVADVKRGDVVTVQTSRGRSYGDHIALVYAVLGETIYTYEGNTRGGITSELERPTRASVCRCERPIQSIVGVYRFENRHREAC